MGDGGGGYASGSEGGVRGKWRFQFIHLPPTSAKKLLKNKKEYAILSVR